MSCQYLTSTQYLMEKPRNLAKEWVCRHMSAEANLCSAEVALYWMALFCLTISHNFVKLSSVRALMFRKPYEISGFSPLNNRLSPQNLMWSLNPVDGVWLKDHNTPTESHQEAGSLWPWPSNREHIIMFYHWGGLWECKAARAQDSHVHQTNPYPVTGAWPVCNKYLWKAWCKPEERPENDVSGVVAGSSWSSAWLPDTEFLPLAELLWLVRLRFPP